MDKAKRMDCKTKGEVILGAETGSSRFRSKVSSHPVQEDPIRFRDRPMQWSHDSDRIQNSLFDLHSRKSEVGGSNPFCRCYKNEVDGERSAHA